MTRPSGAASGDGRADPEHTGGTDTLVVAFAGLPGTGKSTLARRLAARLGAPLLDKDRLREALFGPAHVEYSDRQNDFCCELLHRATDHLQAGGIPVILLDGRTYSRASQVAALEHAMRRPGRRLVWIECTACEEIVLERLAADRDGTSPGATHPAADRGAQLYAHLRAVAEPLEQERLTLDTGRLSPSELEERCLDYLGLPGLPGPPGRPGPAN